MAKIDYEKYNRKKLVWDRGAASDVSNVKISKKERSGPPVCVFCGKEGKPGKRDRGGQLVRYKNTVIHKECKDRILEMNSAKS